MDIYVIWTGNLLLTCIRLLRLSDRCRYPCKAEASAN